MMNRILSQVELASLPRNRRQNCTPSRFESRMIVAGDEPNPFEATIHEALQE